MTALSRFDDGPKPRLRSAAGDAAAAAAGDDIESDFPRREGSDAREPSSSSSSSSYYYHYYYARRKSDDCGSSSGGCEGGSSSLLPRISSLSSSESSWDATTATTRGAVEVEPPPSNGRPHRRSSKNPPPGSSSSTSSMLRHVLATTVARQTRGLTKDFRSNGLPWKGPKCRSIVSGGSGVLYGLPALACCSASGGSNHRFEQYVWIAQGMLSVTADYVFIDRDSCFHGIDRVTATSLFVGTVIRVAARLRMISLAFAVVPLLSFVLAERAKQRLDLRRWIYSHFLWHVTSSVTLFVVVYLLHRCPDGNDDDEATLSTTGDDYLQRKFCRHAS